MKIDCLTFDDSIQVAYEVYNNFGDLVEFAIVTEGNCLVQYCKIGREKWIPISLRFPDKSIINLLEE